MNEKNAKSPPVYPEGVNKVFQKLQNKKEIILKTSSSSLAQGYLLYCLTQESDFPNSPVLILVADEIAKTNILHSACFWQDNQNNHKIKIIADTNPASLSLLNKEKQIIYILSEDELSSKVAGREEIKNTTISIKAEEKISKQSLLEKLIQAGYSLDKTAPEPGLMASRGSLLDVFPAQSDKGIRVDFFGDTIESIKKYSPGEKPNQEIKEVSILPFNLNNSPKKSTLSSYLKNNLVIKMDSFPAEYDLQIIFSNSELNKLDEKRGSPITKPKKKSLEFIKNLEPGDFVIHADHGIAKFAGIVNQPIEGIEREYFKLIYAGEDKLFLPVTMAEKMEKYIGEANPALNKLSGNSNWQATVSKVKLDTLKEARELLNIHARRELSRSLVIPRSVSQEKKLAQSFPFSETKDQKETIEKTYQEMSQTKPMDRLVCGDVGFGKTEVILRAAAKTALCGQQTAILCPTTILAQQHLDNFQKRLNDLPVTVAGLSRFQSKNTQSKTLNKLAKGEVDIIIGTHRLLSSDVKFKNLNLIIIDEEQRFGVKHKEALKKLRSQAHVLTLSATPIPRTLHLGLSGIYNISVITTPPEGRLPIETHIEPHNHTKIKNIIEKEIKRGGQAYYLYNNIQSINIKKQELETLLPKVKFAILHGQLPEAEIASTMHKFDTKKIDVLVCSTIIENGLDLPNVNTLVVDNAPEFGLSQLHQIRGRIGRGKRQAYAYFFYNRQKLSGEAQKRLEALEAARELGSGFDLAMRDMEIRGVGNVLGRRQHGHVRSVGLGLYIKLLNKAVEEIKSGKKQSDPIDVSIDLPLEARIPEYFEHSKQKRIEMYHEWAIITNLEELNSAKSDLEKSGRLPKILENLFYIFKLKILARHANIKSVDTAFDSKNSNKQIIILKTEKPVLPEIFSRLLDISSSWHYSAEEIKIKLNDLGENWTEKLEKCLRLLSETK